VFGFSVWRSFDAAYAGGGNAGQLDLVWRCRWVRDNIAQFGGIRRASDLSVNPAAGAKIATLLANAERQGLFQRALTMSGQTGDGVGADAARERAARVSGRSARSPQPAA